MPIDDDGAATEHSAIPDSTRRRLEAVAYGAGSSPKAAREARLTLARLTGTAADAAGPDAPARQRSGPEGRRTPAPHPAPGGSPTPPPRAQTDATATSQHGGPTDAATGLQTDARSSDGAVDATGGVGVAAVSTPPTRRWPRLFTRTRLRRAGVVAALVAAGVAGYGAAVGVQALRSPERIAAAESARVTADGSVTLTQLLAAEQTFADQLPGSIVAPVRLHSTRLVFSNRSLSADDSATPWDVYAAAGNDPGTVCLIATADGRTSSQSCFPRSEALTGDVVLVAQSGSGILAVRVDAGVVVGRVAPNP